MFSFGWLPDELNHELSSTITGIDKEIQSISIIDDEKLWPVQINIMSYHDNGKVCEKRSELISQHFTNDDEILSIANFDSLGLLSIEICQKLPQPDFIVAVYAG